MTFIHFVLLFCRLSEYHIPAHNILQFYLVKQLQLLKKTTITDIEFGEYRAKFQQNAPHKTGNSMIIKGAVVITGPAWYSINISIFFQLFFHQTGY
ncbi:MAG: hypothetical protein KAJ25_09225, partial [Desulfobacula sp.]|nr:hypothetical protein [Desulfobacula sp.]